jgi:hypothetical protein
VSRLQTAPLGLLGALEMKVGGDNPSEFGALLQPTFEGAAFYLSKGMQIAQVATNHATIADGDLDTLPVPDGEAWWLWSVSGAIALAAGDSFDDAWQLYVGYQYPSAGGINLAINIGPPAPTGALTAGVSLRAGGWCPRPILLPPGSALIVRTCGSATIAAPVPMVIAALYTPVPV